LTPSEFLALTRKNASPGNARAYRAMTEGGGNETFLTLHLRDGKSHSLAYSQLSLISGEERAGTLIRLMFRTASPHLQGLQLQPIIEAIRTRRAAHVYEFDSGHYDPPEPGAPVIAEIWFETERSKAAASGEG
jgi:hypothetical protein